MEVAHRHVMQCTCVYTFAVGWPIMSEQMFTICR